MNPQPGSSMLIHPTTASVHLFEILQGKFSYVKGQTLHASLRNPGVFSRQLFIHLYKTTLSSCLYDDVIADWQKFENGIRSRWKNTDCESDSFKRSTFQSWVETMKITLDNLLLNNLHHMLHAKTNLSYERYVDWVVTVGLVPVVNTKPNKSLIKEIQAIFLKAFNSGGGDHKTMNRIFSTFQTELSNLLEIITSIYIPDYSEVQIFYEPDEVMFYALYKTHKVQVEVINRPFIFNGTITFDSPVQRLFHTIMSCYRTTEHAKLCQLLNTSPMKAIMGSSSNNVYQDILAQLEDSSKKTDPRKEMLQLLVKLAENKTVSGVTDVVEDFITDVSQHIVDKNKLFGGTSSSTESTADSLKKQVSSTVFKCITNQINEQFDTINKLHKEREGYISKLHLLESLLTKCQTETQPGTVPQANLLTTDTLKCLKDIGGASLAMSSSLIPQGNMVMNSFMSQYVPPFRELIKDLASLWESEIFETFKLTPVVDNQGQRLYVKYTQDTISVLLGPFTYIISKLYQMELITDVYSSMSINEIADNLYKLSRLSVYIADIGTKYIPVTQDAYNTANGQSAANNIGLQDIWAEHVR
ncbi:minor capsid protein [Harp seal herpesvirus]|uniref:Minor capsid protein n=1 Tax=phocid gammaherpesvirus 3 TaxID=2560643 RepID=A0A0R5X8M4_9GAMA|nr:minor capsid protein [Harp seal herpesvirus]AJG42967.1 minor capsid protein [Harp seal herpesvirus]